jgi:hypothetical protein
MTEEARALVDKLQRQMRKAEVPIPGDFNLQ